MCFENTMWFYLECKSNCLYLFIYFADTKRYRTCWCNRDGSYSINPEAYKSPWYTARSAVSRTLSLIYVIGNLSNTIFLNCICFFPPPQKPVSPVTEGGFWVRWTPPPPPQQLTGLGKRQKVRLDHIWMVPQGSLRKLSVKEDSIREVGQALASFPGSLNHREAPAVDLPVNGYIRYTWGRTGLSISCVVVGLSTCLLHDWISPQPGVTTLPG